MNLEQKQDSGFDQQMLKAVHTLRSLPQDQPVTVLITFEGVTDEVDRVISSLGLREEPVIGGLYNEISAIANATLVHDVWRSPGDAENFYMRRLSKALAQIKYSGRPQIEVRRLHYVNISATLGFNYHEAFGVFDPSSFKDGGGYSGPTSSGTGDKHSDLW